MAENDVQRLKWPVYLASVLLGIVILIFIVALISTGNVDNSDPENLTSTTYMATVTPLMADADPEQGATLVETQACAGCHRAAADRVAPAFEGIADRAAARRPPLSAEAYLYESIIDPMAYVVEGYAPAMPQDFADRLSDEQVGDLIAYLLSGEAH